MNAVAIRRRLLAWYRENKRDLPWRRTVDPYRIWISEIMLQQTRVAAVIPYYDRFVARFPDVAALARASEQDVLTAWAGLGYYRRARNLHRAAKQILERGGFPRDYAGIRQLAGVGDYTAAAIASIAFGLPYAAIDGNAARVLARLTAESGDIDAGVVRRRLRAAADSVMDPKHAGEFNQAVMELGAMVCLPQRPQCELCPLARECGARQAGLENELPLRSIRPETTQLERQLLVIERAGKVLVWQRPSESRRLAGFWELPESEQLDGARRTGEPVTFRHTIVNTSYFFEVFRAALRGTPDGFRWLSKKELDEVPLSTTAKKALACLARYEGGREE